MSRSLLLLFALLLLSGGWTSLRGEELQSVTVPFYSGQITLSYHPDIIPPEPVTVNERGLMDFYQASTRRNFHVILQALQEQRMLLQLNDWLFYELLHRAVHSILAGFPIAERELTSWVLLSQAGFDTRITFKDKQVFLYVYSTDEVFEAPMIKEKGRTYVNLTSLMLRQQSQGALYLLNFSPCPNGRSFSFYLERLPRLPARTHTKQYEFAYGQYVFQIEVEIDQTAAEVMQQYPLIAEEQYLEVPLSPTLSQSLLPKLREMLRGKNNRQALEFLVSFTRSSFSYKDDKDFFGRSKPMIADEVFHYPYSDCEDRSALFYRLVRELLDLPMIIVAYRDHLTIAVALDQAEGAFISYNGRKYYICDPTGPVNSSAIGLFPRGYEGQPYEIIGRYK